MVENYNESKSKSVLQLSNIFLNNIFCGVIQEDAKTSMLIILKDKFFNLMKIISILLLIFSNLWKEYFPHEDICFHKFGHLDYIFETIHHLTLPYLVFLGMVKKI